MNDPSRAVEHAARESYGRLLAYLSKRTHDISMAEDALAEAFAKAMAHWPERGVPGNPDAWLLTTARNTMTDRQRHMTRFPTESEVPDLPATENGSPLPDERLSLLMVCAHPAIAPDLHVPLMLQTVLGLEARIIARLFLISPAALTKRLGRAEAKIRDARIPFAIPDAEMLPARSAAICEAIYAVHAHDWLNVEENLGEEALYLADLLCRLLPDLTEAKGLAALIAYSQSRAKARVVDDQLVPTGEQDVALWDPQLIAYARQRLVEAHRQARPGRFQIEAAIEAVHIDRRSTGRTDWEALNKLYFALTKIAPSAGALVGQATVTGHLFGEHAGLAALEAIEADVGQGFLPLWAARADLHTRAKNFTVSISCYQKALSGD